MSEQTAPVHSGPARVGGIVLWGLQIALAAYFVHSGYLLFGDGLVKKFDEIGFGQWLRHLTGAVEIAGALGLLVPRLCGLAALGLVGVMAGAAGTELFLPAKGDAKLPLILLVAAAAVAFLRRDTIRAALAQVAARFGK